MLSTMNSGVANENASRADRAGKAGVERSMAVGRTAFFENRNKWAQSKVGLMMTGTVIAGSARSWAGRTDDRRAKQHSVKTDVVAAAASDPWPLCGSPSPLSLENRGTRIGWAVLIP